MVRRRRQYHTHIQTHAKLSKRHTATHSHTHSRASMNTITFLCCFASIFFAALISHRFLFSRTLIPQRNSPLRNAHTHTPSRRSIVILTRRSEQLSNIRRGTARRTSSRTVRTWNHTSVECCGVARSISLSRASRSELLHLAEHQKLRNWLRAVR